jgi:Cellulase (glycosyl hydrolase family 5)
MAMIPALLLTLTSLGQAPMENVRVSADGKGFVLTPSGKPFTPWGLNYGNSGRLIEDFWETDWPTVVEDFKEMKDLGANVVRVHLQFGKFMEAKDRPNAKALERLGKLLQLAEDNHLYLDLTGLGCYRTADVPKWFDGLSEADRWAAQAVFWGAIAETCSKSPAVFCYDLMNEPLAGGERKPGDWYSGKPFGGYDFLQWIALDMSGRDRDEVVRLWIKRLTGAIREKDRRHMITVGLLPWVPTLGYMSGFVPEKVAPELDFMSVHIYPEKGKVGEAIANIKRFAVGKPLVIEETFNLACSAAEIEDFIEKSRPIACGWMGHYDGMTIEQSEEARRKGILTISQAIYRDWLELFRKLSPK